MVDFGLADVEEDGMVQVKVTGEFVVHRTSSSLHYRMIKVAVLVYVLGYTTTQGYQAGSCGVSCDHTPALQVLYNLGGGQLVHLSGKALLV